MIDRKRYNYDFSRLEDACDRFIENQNPTNLKYIQTELNRFFTDSECIDIIYTNNINNYFFGMMISPQIEVQEILQGSSEYRVKNYILEIDSKLLLLNITSSEFVAILLHEIGHIVNDSTPAKEVRKEIDRFLADNRDVILKSESISYSDFISFGIKDAYRKVNSMFTRNNEEILADEFVFMCGYGNELQSAFEKVLASTGTITKNVPNNEFMTLVWTLTLYKNIKQSRLRAIRTLNKCKDNTGSKIEKMEINTAIEQLSHSTGTVNESAVKCTKDYHYLQESIISKLSLRGVRGLQDDVFEYKLRIRNVEEEDDALLLMRQINLRMSLLKDYMNDNPDSKENVSLSKTLSQYEDLRQELCKKVTYSRKSYGIWTDFNLKHVEDY